MIIDGVIEGDHLREELIRLFSSYESKDISLPRRRRSVLPV